MELDFVQLVAYHNLLEHQSCMNMRKTLSPGLDHILHTVERHADFASLALIEKQQQIQTAFDQFEQELDRIKWQVRDKIAQQETVWYQRSYQQYEGTLQDRLSQRPEFVQEYRNQRRSISAEMDHVLQSRVMRYGDWRHAGMIIHPGSEQFLDHLVGLDPLYLVDESLYLLEPVLAQHTEVYQRRLRTYTIEENLDRSILSQIPNDQFAFCLVYNYFEFRPVDMIRRYLDEIWHKLKPGGVLAMTFNDCDRVSAVQLVDRNFACYTPGRVIRNLAQLQGYEIEFEWSDEGPTTWLELKRPGTLTSLRGGQTLAKIVPYSVENSK